MSIKMKNDFPRIYISPEVRRKMIEIAREFRKTPTKSQKILWEALRGKKFDGIKFRRQQPIGYFVVDFYNLANPKEIPSPFMGEGQGGG